MESWTWGDILVFFFCSGLMIVYKMPLFATLAFALKFPVFVCLIFPFELITEFKVMSFERRCASRTYSTFFQFSALSFTRWMLRTFKPEAIRNIFFSEFHAIALFQFRRFKYGTENVGDFSYYPSNKAVSPELQAYLSTTAYHSPSTTSSLISEQVSGYWVKSKCRLNLPPDLVVYFVPGAIGGCISPYMYIEFLAMLLVELQVQGFSNPVAYCLDTDFHQQANFGNYELQVLKGWHIVSTSYPGSKTMFLGSGIGGTALVDLLLYISRPQSKIFSPVSPTFESNNAEGNSTGLNCSARGNFEFSDAENDGNASSIEYKPVYTPLGISQQTTRDDEDSKTSENHVPEEALYDSAHFHSSMLQECFSTDSVSPSPQGVSTPLYGSEGSPLPAGTATNISQSEMNSNCTDSGCLANRNLNDNAPCHEDRVVPELSAFVQGSVTAPLIEQSDSIKNTCFSFKHPDAVVLLSPVLKAGAHCKIVYPDFITQEIVNHMRSIVESDGGKYGSSMSICSGESMWWSDAIPKRGISFYFGDRETLKPEIQQFTEMLRNVGQSRIFTDCREDEVHSWPITNAYVGRTTTDQLDGITVVAGGIAKMLAIDCLFAKNTQS